MKKSALAYALTLALGAPAVFAGNLISIDPDDGAATGDPALNVAVLDWGPGNSLSIGTGGSNIVGLCGTSSGTCTRTVADGNVFQTYAHARLNAFEDENGAIGGLKLNASGGYEWTFVTGFQETVTSLVGSGDDSNANFEIVDGGDNFFRIYYDTARNSNQLTGAGFNDGTLILEGRVLSHADSGTGQSGFAADVGYELFDQFLGSNYGTRQSIIGTGGSQMAVDVTFFDADFFIGQFQTLLLDFDTQQNLAYDKVNPSACFHSGTGAQINGAGGQGTTCRNSVGTINGANGANVMFQNDASTSFESESVPEPASLALLGAGLLGLGATRRRKNNA